MFYVCNAFSINMLEGDGTSVVFNKVPLYEIQGIVRSFDEDETVNAIGHKDLLAVVNSLVDVPQPTEERPTVSLKRGDELLVAQYRGPRLPEGTTKLPEGATIEWWYVSIG